MPSVRNFLHRQFHAVATARSVAHQRIVGVAADSVDGGTDQQIGPSGGNRADRDVEVALIIGFGLDAPTLNRAKFVARHQVGRLRQFQIFVDRRRALVRYLHLGKVSGNGLGAAVQSRSETEGVARGHVPAQAEAGFDGTLPVEGHPQTVYARIQHERGRNAVSPLRESLHELGRTRLIQQNTGTFSVSELIQQIEG